MAETPEEKQSASTMRMLLLGLIGFRGWQEQFLGNMSYREFVDTITRDLLGSRCFVFTPKGEIKNLPKGATAIDNAYMIHCDTGNKMVAADVLSCIYSAAVLCFVLLNCLQFLCQ
ncbi:putative GTP diphosphokinase RSH1, chloroplastic [Andrographis paniculata]|uniref:putative GTP diphosphokinase RSH1, chloroplastic n=1 Tax=Andrographis paniculata TaxID=175694 RepID=UPI0021E8255E|nr:putative GTP diphosphokinase RSH1, chloroplastic [Andrographis paniculata]